MRIPATILLGAVGGLMVGLTSVGSGSIIIISLMLLYPQLRGAHLVGTDLVQAVPLVAAAALAHILVGDFELALTTSILIGALPAVYVGARLSSKAPDGIIRPALVFVLLASALKLDADGSAKSVLLAVAPRLFRRGERPSHPDAMWRSAGLERSAWVKRLAFTAPIGVGFGFAVVYFAKIRPRVEMAPSVHELEVVDAPSIEPVGTPTVDG